MERNSKNVTNVLEVFRVSLFETGESLLRHGFGSAVSKDEQALASQQGQGEKQIRDLN
jgi:hypothetical protein